MKFTHLIAVDDQSDPSSRCLTRQQLWRGLVLRATMPEAFVPHLERCTLLDQSDLLVGRELQYGEVIVRDVVRFTPQQRIVYDVPAQEGIPQSRLTVTIEESDRLCVRFEYEDDASAEQDAANAFYDDFRRSAYRESDFDTIRTIREMAGDGRLEG